MKINMQAARINANLTPKQMAEKLGVTDVTVRNWEKGKGLPNIQQAQMWAVACGLLIEDIDFLRPYGSQKANNKDLKENLEKRTEE